MIKTVSVALLAVAVAAILAASPASARQVSIYGGVASLNLSDEDLSLMSKAAREQMDGKPDGTVNSWSNPKSGNSGKATLNKTSIINGQTCRRVTHTIMTKQKPEPASYFVNICKQPDGSWKLKF